MFNRDLYLQHLEQKLAFWNQTLVDNKADGAVIPSGQPKGVFEDDNLYPYKPNFHFSGFVPENSYPHSYLILKVGDKPKLVFYQPADFWHLVPSDPNPGWADAFDVLPVRDTNAWVNHVDLSSEHWIWVGEEESLTSSQFNKASINPHNVVKAIHYDRAYKTDYEIDCLAEANVRAVKGHLAARKAFISGASEYEIHMSYLAATQHTETDLPYGNIIALGPHGAILHYTHLDVRLPDAKQAQSFLIDAGAKTNNYCADITRTWSMDETFAALIESFDELQQSIVAAIQPGVSFVDLHIQTHHKIARFMIDHDLAKGSSDEMVRKGITSVFYPHGLGHLLGLQVHDIGGHQQDPLGTVKAPPEAHPFLRLTRQLEPGMCVTIEPGLYFIPLLMDQLRSKPEAAMVNWDLIAQLSCFGGIRIEDDVMVTDYGYMNLSRQAFEQVGMDD